MEALIEALEKDPNIQRRKWAAAAGGALIVRRAGFGGLAVIVKIERRYAAVGRRSSSVFGIFGSLGEPEPPRHAQIRKAFMQTGKSYAPDVFVTVSRALTAYAENWANMHKEACEATQVRREQSAEVMDLRMACLHERLAGFER